MKGFLILIFGVLIGVILYIHKVYTLGGIPPVVVMYSIVVLLLIIIALLSFALILHRNRNLKGEITTLEGFYFVLMTFTLGIILSESSFYLSFWGSRYSVFRDYSGDLQGLIKEIFIDSINVFKRYFIPFLVITLISLIIAKIHSRSTPSV
jgi:hypothetical protein